MSVVVFISRLAGNSSQKVSFSSDYSVWEPFPPRLYRIEVRRFIICHTFHLLLEIFDCQYCSYLFFFMVIINTVLFVIHFFFYKAFNIPQFTSHLILGCHCCQLSSMLSLYPASVRTLYRSHAPWPPPCRPRAIPLSPRTFPLRPRNFPCRRRTCRCCH